MDQSSPDPVRAILEELKSDPQRFQRTEGYVRLLALVEGGRSPSALKNLLREHTNFVGDLLWTVCELDNVEPYVEEAALHLRSSDPGTSGYALEVLLRGARDSKHCQLALSFLESAPSSAFEHAVFVLASQGLERARIVFRLGGWNWAAAQVEELLGGFREMENLAGTIKELVADQAPDHIFVGLMIAVLSSEQSEIAVQALEHSQPDRFRGISTQLRRMFEDRWL